jgi:hypothetical protein
MKNAEEEFKEWYGQPDEDEPEFLIKVPEQMIKDIWMAGYRAGGHQPWWSINKQQFQVLQKNLSEQQTNE